MSFHTVIIDAKLEPAKVYFNPVQSQSSVEYHWLHKVEENHHKIHESGQNYRSLYTTANGPCTEMSPNTVLQAFISAYNQHHDIVLSPDDMWMLVCLEFAVYINNNAKHQGKIELTVRDFQGEHE